MRRRSLGLAVVALLVLSLGLFVVRDPAPLAAQSGTPTAGQGFVGAWRITITEPGSPPLQGLTTFAADGTLLNSDQPVSPTGGGQPATISSAGHGVWHQTGPTTAALTFVELVTDLQGQFLGTTTISGQTTLSADGNALHGSFSVTVADPSGKVLFVGTGTVAATRITLQPMATPAPASPVMTMPPATPTTGG